MARPYRIQAEDCFYHITSRGDNLKAIYLNDTDRQKFLEYISIAKDKFKFFLYAYCLMNNHYHLFIETTQANLSRIMQYINTAYTVYYNIKRSKSGHLFQGRYKSIVVDRETYFAELTRYIHLNPVRAHITKSPTEYPWSSYQAYVSENGRCLVDIDRVKQFLGMGFREYPAFVANAGDNNNPFANLYAGCMLGSVQFIKERLNRLRDEVDTKDFAHKRAITNSVDSHDIITAVAKHFKMDPEVLRTSNSRPMTAKQMAIYLMRRMTGATAEKIGEIFTMKPAAVSKAALRCQRQMIKDNELAKAVKKITSSFRV